MNTNVLDNSGVVSALQEGSVTLQGQFLNSTNYTFLGTLKFLDFSFPVVYKPIRGERPLWDFPQGTLAKREVAAFVMSKALGWDLVPATVFRDIPPLGPGSLQQYVVHNPEEHYFTFSADLGELTKKIVLFDALINNADRKASHVLRDESNHYWLIDHGICFHEEDKLRTVIWEYAGQPIPASLIADLRTILQGRDVLETLRANLVEYLAPREIRSLARRAQRLIRSGCFPEPGEDYRPYPWPPV